MHFEISGGLLGPFLQTTVEPSMSVNRNVTAPVGRSAMG